MIVGLSALAIVNLKLALFVAAWCVIYSPSMYRMSLKLGRLSQIETESRHDLMGRIADNMGNIISLFSFASRRREMRNLHTRMSNDFIPKQIKTYKYDFKMQVVGGILYFFLFAFILFYMVDLRINNLVTVGDFAFVFSMILLVTDDIWHITTSLQDFSRGMGDAKSSLSVLQIAHQNPDQKDALPLIMVEPKIEFRNISFSYQDKEAIFKGLGFAITAGEKVGLVGSSGAGKSSLIHLLLRYFVPDAGEVLVSNIDIKKITQDSLREHIAVIPQDTMLFHRTLMENIRYGKPDATDEDVVEAAKKAHIHDYILTLPDQYNEHVGERGVKLSGGQRQRIAIARAILKNASILVLDEATSALDSETEQLIQDSLNFLIEDKQKTVIAIAHRLSTLQHMDRIIVLDEGGIGEEGTHSELLERPDSLYRRLWLQQSQHIGEVDL